MKSKIAFRWVLILYALHVIAIPLVFIFAELNTFEQFLLAFYAMCVTGFFTYQLRKRQRN